MFDLSTRRALVTGASGKIGSAIVRALHASGAQVVLSGTRGSALKALAHELRERTAIVEADLSDAVEVGELVGRATDEMGGIDILINNAGITRDNLAMRMKDEEWQSILDINLTAGFRLSRAALRPMMKQRWGRIIGITSVVGVIGNPGQANYAAAKAGVMALTRCAAVEAADFGVRINAVSPSLAVHPMLKKSAPEELLAELEGREAYGRGAEVWEVANVMMFLASDYSSYLTGETISCSSQHA